MKWLLDTMVVSQTSKPQPNSGVLRWLAERADLDVALSVVTIAELQFGMSRMPASKKRDALRHWLESDLKPRFGDRILDISSGIADLWGRECGRLSTQGRILPLLDSLIGATALYHNLIVVTRDEEPFHTMGVPVENPWS